MSLQYGDTIKFAYVPKCITNIICVVPTRYDAIDESWIVCEQGKATHMMIVTEVSDGVHELEYRLIEIGKCENIYLLADAIVD